MSTATYPSEKGSLPLPATQMQQPAGPSFIVRLARVSLIFFATMFVLDAISDENPSMRESGPACMGHRKHDGHHGGHGQHPFPPIDKWVPFQGESYFEFDPEMATGLSIKGANSFGKVVFETSKLSDKVTIDLDIKTSKTDKNNDVTVVNDNGFVTINSPDTGKLKVHTAAKISIPSNIIGTFGLPAFEVDVVQHMIDLSGLPESLEIGELIVRAAKGFVKAGPVHTNTTQITVADGGVKGALTHARVSTNVDVAKGNVTLDISKISSGSEGETKIHLGNGDLKGTFSIYNSTTLDVASGSIYVNVDFEDSESDAAELSTKIASGDARVYVNAIAEERIFKAYHTSISGSQLITYPSNFQGTVDARGLVGDIKLAGKELAVEKAFGGSVGKKGDSERNYVSVKSAKGSIDLLVGDEE